MVDKILIADNTIEEITVQEFSGAPTGTIITSTHGMDRGDQHTIRDIVGLKTKLHDIEKLHQVRSNLGGHADYYQWGEEATENNPIGPGYFVRLDEDNKIHKCTNEMTDILGVTVGLAGFVGNDEDVVGTHTSAKATNVNYALVATTGVVDVLCYHDVAVGDYVFPTADGLAAKSTGSYGYLVTALIQDAEVLYARIVLAQSTTNEKKVSDNIDWLLTETKRIDTNITTFGNTAEAALKRAEELTEAAQNSANASNQVAQDATNAAINAQKSATNAWNVSQEALTLKDEAIVSATEVAAQIATDKSNETLNTVRALEYRVDKYTVGQYSQAYGLTYAQAQAILPLGTTFIPMDEDPTATGAKWEYEEGYGGDIKQVFTAGYAYVWTANGWLVDKTVLITREPTEQTDGDYWFVVKEYDGDAYQCGSLYRWEDSVWKEVAIRKENIMNRTMAHLYHDDHTIRQSVDAVDGRVSTVETKVTETEAKVGLVAASPTGIQAKPGNYNEEKEALDIIVDKATLDANWTDKAVVGKYYVVGNKLPYKVYEWNGSEFVLKDTVTYDGVNLYKANVASIFTTANEDGSDIRLNADKLNFSGVAAFVCNENGSITEINGNSITTGVIQSANGNVKIDLTNGDVDITGGDVNITGRIVATSGEIGGCTIDEEGNLKVTSANIEGQLTADKIEAININTEQLQVDKLSALSSNMGEIEAGIIQSPEYDDGTEVIVWGETEINDEQEELTPSEGLAYTLSADETYYIVTCGTCTDSHIVIPLTYNGKPVESIGDSAFDSCTNLTSIVIPDSIISIGNFAFIGCSSLTNITMSSSVISIGDSAFAECSSLISIVIPNGVVSIGQFAFWDCNSLISIIIPDSITTMGTAVFQKCDLLTIYCEAESQPSGWNSAWNSSDCPVYWYSETQPTTDGNYWHYKTPQGFQISCKGKYMINSPNFKVTQDGQIEATNGEFRGHLTTGSGYIGNLKIEDNGISATIDDQVILSVSSLGVISTNSLQAADGVVANTLQSFDEAAKLDFSATKTTTTEIGREVVDIALEGNIIDEGSENFWGTITNEGRVSLTVDIGDTVFQVPQVLSIKVKYNRFNAFGDEYTQTSNHTVTLPAGQTTATIYIPYRILANDGHTMYFNTAAVMTELTKINEASKEERAIACTGHFIPADGLTYTLGAKDIKWKEAWINAVNINTEYTDSDKNKKHNISTLTNQHSEFFDKLKPVAFIYNDDTENKIRTGLIAQDTKQALDEVGLDNYAIYHEWQESNGDNTCSLVYQDLIALCINEIQKLKKQNTELEDRLKELENKTK